MLSVKVKYNYETSHNVFCYFIKYFCYEKEVCPSEILTGTKQRREDQPKCSVQLLGKLFEGRRENLPLGPVSEQESVEVVDIGSLSHGALHLVIVWLPVESRPTGEEVPSWYNDSSSII